MHTSRGRTTKTRPTTSSTDSVDCSLGFFLAKTNPRSHHCSGEGWLMLSNGWRQAVSFSVDLFCIEGTQFGPTPHHGYGSDAPASASSADEAVSIPYWKVPFWNVATMWTTLRRSVMPDRTARDDRVRDRCAEEDATAYNRRGRDAEQPCGCARTSWHGAFPPGRAASVLGGVAQRRPVSADFLAERGAVSLKPM